MALEHLKKGNRDKKVLIVVSDGGDNASKYKLSQILAMAGQSDAIIYTIGIYTDEDPDKNPDALRQLSKATGGEAFFPQTLPDVVPICERIAHDIREQYTLAYAPANIKQDGAYRVIQVKARRRVMDACPSAPVPVITHPRNLSRQPPLPAARATGHDVQN